MADDRQAAALARALIPFRRRLRLSLLARAFPIAVAIALGATDVVLLTARPGAGVALAACAAALALAGIAAWTHARWRIPSTAVAARLVDARFGLEDRIVTALQFAEASDDVSRVVVSDALSRLELAPVSRIRLAFPGPGRWAALAALLVTASVATGLIGGVEPPGAVVEIAAGTAGPSTLAGLPAHVGSRQAARRGDLGPTHRVTEAEPAAGGGRGGTNREETGTFPTPNVTAPRPGADSAGGAPSIRDGSDGGASGAAGSGRGAGAPGAAGADAGGVRHGAIVAATPASSPRPADGARLDGTTYRQAVTRAETAIARDRVPAPLRAYVREYFLAIRPQQEP